MGERGQENVAEFSQEYLDTVDEQLEMVLAAHREVETRTLSFVDRTEDQLEELQEQSQEEMSEQIAELMGRIEELREQLEA